MKPGTSRSIRMTDLPITSYHFAAQSTASGEVRSPPTTSTRGMR